MTKLDNPNRLGKAKLIPLNYDTFLPPAVGGAYIDPAFGTSIRRISDAMHTANDDGGAGNLSWITPEYSTMSPFNLTNSRILLLHQSYFGMYDGDGRFMHSLPLEISSSSEPRWSRKGTYTLFYVRGNQLKAYCPDTGSMAVLREFSEYSSISGKGESDISLDGEHFVFAGDDRYVFVYQLNSDTKFPVFDTGGRGFDSMYITPSNNVTITWNQSGTARYTGIELYDINMNFQRQVAHAGGHMDVCRDVNGDDVLIWTNSNDSLPIADCNNGIVKIRLSDGLQTCLLPLDWSLAVHVSAPDSAGFVYVETFAPSNPQPNSSNWAAYTNEILRIKLDGSEVLRLAHHRSRQYQTNTYNWQPKTSCSRDGTRFVFGSNFNLQTIEGRPEQYSDVYLVESTSPVRRTQPIPKSPAE